AAISRISSSISGRSWITSRAIVSSSQQFVEVEFFPDTEGPQRGPKCGHRAVERHAVGLAPRRWVLGLEDEALEGGSSVVGGAVEGHAAAADQGGIDAEGARDEEQAVVVKGL